MVGVGVLVPVGVLFVALVLFGAWRGLRDELEQRREQWPRPPARGGMVAVQARDPIERVRRVPRDRDG